MIKFIQHIPNESIVDLQALVTEPEVPVEACSQKLELQVQRIFVVNRSKTLLPFQIADASKKVDKATLNEAEDSKKEEDDGQVNVHMKTRLDNRILDLRTPGKQAIFRI